MKLLVMGSGYVGMALLKRLQSTPHEIYLTTTCKEKADRLKAYGKDVLILDQAKEEEYKQWVEACDAMIILVAPKNGQSYEETYLNTAKRIARAVEGRKKPLYLLYTSSTSVCEGIKQEQEWITEEMALAPTTENGKILLENENIYLQSKINTCILRLGGIYGPQRELIHRAQRFSGKEMPANRNERTNHIHLDDIVEAIIFCLDHSLRGIYHLVNDDHTLKKELYSRLCESIHIPSPIWNKESLEKEKNGGIISNQKIKNAGFIFRYPFLCLDP